jgi:chlorite dismutase
MNERSFTFIGGVEGPWAVSRVEGVIGERLPDVARLGVASGLLAAPPGAVWAFRGVTSHERYVTRAEKDRLAAVQPPLGRPEATCAALIPIRKATEWWALPQDERRDILEERSHHIALGLTRLPAIARRLYHCRDLGEPFDFITWFEYAPVDASSFELLVSEMRGTEEWRYVEREVDVRLERA